jgi:hypothetical protein
VTLPPYRALRIWLQPNSSLPLDFAYNPPLEVVHLVRSLCELGRADVVWAAVGQDSVLARLPYARCEVESRLWGGHAKPVHDQLEGDENECEE